MWLNRTSALTIVDRPLTEMIETSVEVLSQKIHRRVVWAEINLHDKKICV